MPRWVFAAAILTTLVALPVVPAQGGWFSHGGHNSNDCCPSCAAPTECCPPPTCCVPQQCAPVAPSCCAPAAPVCCAPAAPVCCAPVAPSCGCPDQCAGNVCCDSGHGSCRRESCLSRCFRRLMDLEHRKNRCLKDTFLGWRDKDRCHSSDCAPNYYYQPSCSTPNACY